MAVCSEIHTKHINTLRGQNVVSFNVTAYGLYSNHCISVFKQMICRLTAVFQ